MVTGTLAMSRENKDGSLLIWNFCEELQKASDGQDFLELVTKVFGIISDTSMSLAWGQTPEVLSNATTRLVVKRSENE